MPQIAHVAAILLSYDGLAMQRTDLYIKIEIEHDERETPQVLATEICRQVQKVYGVRNAELSSFVSKTD